MDSYSHNSYISFCEDDNEELQVLHQSSNRSEVNSGDVVWNSLNDIDLSLFNNQLANSPISVDHSFAWEEGVQLQPFTQEQPIIAEYDAILYNSDILLL